MADRNYLTLSFLIIFSLLMMNLHGCTSSVTRESTGEYIDSSTTTARVKAKLIDNLGAKGFSIVVKTFKDEVQLSGFVDSPVVRVRAAQIVADMDGVKSVRNNILLKSTVGN
jgi:osmotically-inducible protein OsmY